MTYVATNGRWFDYEYNIKLVTEPAHKRLMLRLNQEQGEEHKREVLPLHFKPRAKWRYHYAKRTARYLAKKKEMYGDTDSRHPELVATGLLANLVTQKSKVTKTRFGWRIKAKGYFDMNDRLRGEIEIINQNERTEKRRSMRKKYLALVKTPEYARKRSQRGP